MATRKPDAAEAGREFFRRVGREGAWSTVFLLHGEESFLVQEALTRLTAATFPAGRDDFNWTQYRGGEARGADVATAARMIPMFAPTRMIVVREVEQLAAAELEPIADYCQDPEPTTLLVLEARKLDARLKQVGRILSAKAVEVVEFRPLSEQDALPAIVRRARTRRLALARDVPAHLVDSIGTDLSTLDAALERIDLFLGDGAEMTAEGERQVTRETVDRVVVDSRAQDVFRLVDAIAQRDLDASLRILHRLMMQSESPVGAVAMIARQIRQLLLMREGRALGQTDRALATWVGCPPFRVNDLSRMASRFTDAQLRRALEATVQTDRALKSSRLDDVVHVERLILSLCLDGQPGGRPVR